MRRPFAEQDSSELNQPVVRSGFQGGRRQIGLIAVSVFCQLDVFADTAAATRLLCHELVSTARAFVLFVFGPLELALRCGSRSAVRSGST